MFKYKVEMFFILLAKKIIMLFPEEKRYKIGEAIGRLAYKVIKDRREITLDNISKAFPEMSKVEVERIAIKSYETMLKTFIMSLWVPDIVDDDEKVKYENFELFEKIYKEGKGVLIATLHMGAFEASLKLAKSYDLYDVIRKTKNPDFDIFMNDNRRRTGVNLIYKDGSTMKHLINAIKNKGVVALFSDHNQGDTKTKVNFFGREVGASSGAVTLSMKYNIPILIGYNLFNEDNTCTIYFDRLMELELTGDKKKDIDYNTQRLTNIFEEIIKRHPEQWMWFHKRWKNAK